MHAHAEGQREWYGDSGRSSDSCSEDVPRDELAGGVGPVQTSDFVDLRIGEDAPETDKSVGLILANEHGGDRTMSHHLQLRRRKCQEPFAEEFPAVLRHDHRTEVALCRKLQRPPCSNDVFATSSDANDGDRRPHKMLSENCRNVDGVGGRGTVVRCRFLAGHERSEHFQRATDVGTRAEDCRYS